MGEAGASTNIEEIIETKQMLEKNMHAAYMACYLAKHGIKFTLRHKEHQCTLAENNNYFESERPLHKPISITTLTTGLHFSVQWSRPNICRKGENVTENKSKSLIVNQKQSKNMSLYHLNEFLIAIGIIAITISLLVLSFQLGIIIGAIGVGSIVIGGYGLYIQTIQTTQTKKI